MNACEEPWVCTCKPILHAYDHCDLPCRYTEVSCLCLMGNDLHTLCCSLAALVNDKDCSEPQLKFSSINTRRKSSFPSSTPQSSVYAVSELQTCVDN